LGYRVSITKIETFIFSSVCQTELKNCSLGRKGGGNTLFQGLDLPKPAVMNKVQCLLISKAVIVMRISLSFGFA
jgi:hypothetical protein